MNYFAAVGNHKILTQVEEVALCKKIESGELSSHEANHGRHFARSESQSGKAAVGGRDCLDAGGTAWPVGDGGPQSV